MSVSVLVLYDRKGPAIEELAAATARGATNTGLAEVTVKRLEEADRADLRTADGLLLGSPNWSGITGSLKQWLDQQGDLWEEGSLAGKPGAAFATGLGRHSGLEFTLLELIYWMLSCGMVLVGLPWSGRMRRAGSYYGATATGRISDDDLGQAHALGVRLATVAAKLKAK